MRPIETGPRAPTVSGQGPRPHATGEKKTDHKSGRNGFCFVTTHRNRRGRICAEGTTLVKTGEGGNGKKEGDAYFA